MKIILLINKTKDKFKKFAEEKLIDFLKESNSKITINNNLYVIDDEYYDEQEHYIDLYRLKENQSNVFHALQKFKLISTKERESNMNISLIV